MSCASRRGGSWGSFFPRSTLIVSTMSPLSLLYASVGNFRPLSLSGYSIPASPGIHFVALRCTFFIVSMSLTECGAQT